MTKPRLLELFNGDTGGAGASGYERAGFHVVRRPFDQLDLVARHGHRFDAVHAQPSCKGYTAGTRAARASGREYPRQIELAREALAELPDRVLWVIENVGGARASLVNPATLCGSMFGLTATDADGELLRLERHRLFETSFGLSGPRPCQHDRSVRVGGVYGAARTNKWEAQYVRHGGYNPPRAVQEDLMGVPRGQLTRKALKGALPPAYTEWIGSQMLERIA